MDDGREPDERVVPDAAGPVDEGIVRHRDVAPTYTALLAADLHVPVLQRVDDHAVLDVRARADEERRAFIGAHGRGRGDVDVIAEHDLADDGRLVVHVGRGREPRRVRRCAIHFWRSLEMGTTCVGLRAGAVLVQDRAHDLGVVLLHAVVVHGSAVMTWTPNASTIFTPKIRRRAQHAGEEVGRDPPMIAV